MKVILVDDDDVINLVHAEVIKRIIPDVQLRVFKSGGQLIHHLITESDVHFDMMFLDIRMPEMDGFEVLEKLGELDQSLFNGTHIYVLSSTLDERDLQRAKDNPLVTAFISKPLSFDTISNILSGADQ
jgi:CheY-like chemotaxis protein